MLHSVNFVPPAYDYNRPKSGANTIVHEINLREKRIWFQKPALSWHLDVGLDSIILENTVYPISQRSVKFCYCCYISVLIMYKGVFCWKRKIVYINKSH